MAEKKDRKPSEEDDEGNLITRFQKSNGNNKDEPPLHSTLKKGSDQGEEEDEGSAPLYSRIKPTDEEEDEESVPIWQRFTQDKSDSDEDSDDEQDEVGSASKNSKEVVKVRSYVGDMEKEFVDELFGGDEGAFLEAIEQISRLSSWKEAGTYISREVFDRNMIDIYSDTAIYFTDRMQTYFLERN